MCLIYTNSVAFIRFSCSWRLIDIIVGCIIGRWHGIVTAQKSSILRDQIGYTILQYGVGHSKFVTH